MYREQISLSVERLINPVGAARQAHGHGAVPRWLHLYMRSVRKSCTWLDSSTRSNYVYILPLLRYLAERPKLTGRFSAHWRGWFREPVVLLAVVVALKRYSISLEAYGVR
uniref:Uncharacterized protein n=1 Tax=Trichogramma kaykai TaxID=54128 RepID=A0ABD2X2Z7_9HYME